MVRDILPPQQPHPETTLVIAALVGAAQNLQIVGQFFRKTQRATLQARKIAPLRSVAAERGSRPRTKKAPAADTQAAGAGGVISQTSEELGRPPIYWLGLKWL